MGNAESSGETKLAASCNRNELERGFSPRDVRELFRLMDWLMGLPPALAHRFTQELDKIQEERSMPYVTSIERLGIRKGLCKGIESMLKVRFGEEGLKLMPAIREIYEEETLEAIRKALETETSLDEVRRLWSPGTP